MGPGRIYKNNIITVKHLRITPELYFGYTNETYDSLGEYSEDDLSSDFLKKYEDYL